MGKTGPSSIGGGPDSGHETLLSDGEEETSQIHNMLDSGYHHQYHPPHHIERASSEVIYSSISNASSHLGTRSRRSLAEPPSSSVINNKLFSNNRMEDMEHPPMIAPISGVPNIKGKAVIRPIAFRPTPLTSNSGPSNHSQGSPSHLNVFSPGHPLVKDGRRHYGSSQELHVNQGCSSASSGSFNKFNSLDRRALSRRQNLKLSLEPQSNSLIVMSSNSQLGDKPPRLLDPAGNVKSTEPGNNGRAFFDRNLTASVSSNGSIPNSNHSVPNCNNRLKLCDNSNKLVAMNINGLPDPSIYSSQESIHSRLPRPGPGTPQFQNLSGIMRASISSGFGPESSTSKGEGDPHHPSGKSKSQLLYSSDSSSCTIGENQTPSPSDSAVGDLEHMLKEKDTEINYLKETIEQNEQVICKVYEEKEKMWEREFRKVKGLYDNRLRLSQQKSLKMEQALTNQTYHLQNEKRKLELDLEDMKKYAEEKERENASYRQELDHLRNTLKESEWTSCAKSGEISILREQQKQQLHISPSSKSPSKATLLSSSSSSFLENSDLKKELEGRNKELTELRMSRRALQIEVLSLKTQLEKASSEEKTGLDEGEDEEMDEESIRGEILTQKETIISRDLEIEKLRSNLSSLGRESSRLKTEAYTCKENFEVEKAHWLDEKEKVIRYQKQLQLNYVQMYKKNKVFESEIESLKTKLSESNNFSSSSSPNKKSSFLSHLSLSKPPSSSGSGASKSSGLSSSNSSSNATSSSSNSAKSKFFKMTLSSESNC